MILQAAGAEVPRPAEAWDLGMTRTNTALAWFAAVFCLATAGARCATGGSSFGDLVLVLVLGGGAAFFAMALRRELYSAARACRCVAFCTGVANLLMLHTTTTAIVVGLMAGSAGPEGGLNWRLAPALAVAILAAAAPWGVYWALREDRLKPWIAAHIPSC